VRDSLGLEYDISLVAYLSQKYSVRDASKLFYSQCSRGYTHWGYNK
jgi:hypothetical protein